MRRYLGQGGTGMLGASGLERIQNLEGTGKLYAGQTGLRQKRNFGKDRNMEICKYLADNAQKKGVDKRGLG